MFDMDRPDAPIGGSGKTTSCDLCGEPTRSRRGFCRKCARELDRHNKDFDDEDMQDVLGGDDPSFDRDHCIEEDVQNNIRRALGMD